MRAPAVLDPRAAAPPASGAQPGERLAVFFAQRIAANLPLADEDHAGGEWHEAALDVAVAELGEEGDHGLADEAVGLVEQEHQRERVGGRELGQVGQERPVGLGEHRVDLGAGGPRQRGVTPRERALEGEEDRRHRAGHVGLLAGRLEVDPQRPEAPAGLEVSGEPHGAGGLAGLSARVQREVAPRLDEREHVLEAALRRQHVVLAGDARAGGVEVREHRSNTSGGSASGVGRGRRRYHDSEGAPWAQGDRWRSTRRPWASAHGRGVVG